MVLSGWCPGVVWVVPSSSLMVTLCCLGSALMLTVGAMRCFVGALVLFWWCTGVLWVVLWCSFVVPGAVLVMPWCSLGGALEFF